MCFFLCDLSLRRGSRLPEDLPCDSESASLLSGEIFGDQKAVRATEIVNVVGSVLANIDLPIQIGDLVNDTHGDNFGDQTPFVPAESARPCHTARFASLRLTRLLSYFRSALRP